MVRRATPREHETYDVHAMDEFTKTIEETYERFLEENPDYADKWLDRVEECVLSLERPFTLGKTDSEHYSEKYSHIQIPDTQTTIFFLVDDNQIYLVTSGWSRRNWPEVLRETGPEIERQLKLLRERKAEKKREKKPAVEASKEETEKESRRQIIDIDEITHEREDAEKRAGAVKEPEQGKGHNKGDDPIEL